MADAPELNKIEELKKTLYSRRGPDVREIPHITFRPPAVKVNTDWQHPPEEPTMPHTGASLSYTSHRMPFFVKIFIASVIFLIASLGIGAYILFRGGNIVSAHNVDIIIGAPSSVAAGDPFDFEVDVVNKNNIKLELADVTVDYPAGAAQPDRLTEELRRTQEFLGDIDPGSSVQRTMRAALFGEENSVRSIVVRVDYRVTGSSALLHKEKTFDVGITSAPLTLSVVTPKEVNAGRSFDMKVTIHSNSKQVLQNLLLKGQFPFGYTLVSSQPETFADKGTWIIGDLPPGGERVVTLKGTLDAQDDEDRIARFSVGAQSAKNQRTIGTEYVSASQTVTVRKPFLSLNISADGGKIEDYVGEFNSPVMITINYFNNLSSAVNDVEIRAHLDGSAYDKLSVEPETGFFDSSKNDMVWNRQTVADLAQVPPGEGGNVTFRLTPRDKSNTRSMVVNPEIAISLGAKAARSSETNVPLTVPTIQARKLHVGSTLSFLGQGLYHDGPIENTGPIPPRADKETTYTLQWTIYNTSSNIAGAVVTATLPPYVQWANTVAPKGENVTFDEKTRTIRWEAGDVPAYSGASTPPRQAFIKVVVKPSVTQLNQSIALTGIMNLTATDDYTGKEFNLTAQPATTHTASEKSFHDGDDIVRP
jgi:hypothetical protein